jgi:hypothetical protein
MYLTVKQYTSNKGDTMIRITTDRHISHTVTDAGSKNQSSFICIARRKDGYFGQTVECALVYSGGYVYAVYRHGFNKAFPEMVVDLKEAKYMINNHPGEASQFNVNRHFTIEKRVLTV